MFADLTPNQAKVFVDAQQAYRACQDTQEKVNHPALKGGAWSQKTTSQVEAGKAVSNPLR
ncbi:MAG: hypothetical protein IPH35_06585 [Rhodoferax sp.]|nr:hypothetical protein [Rhodoferax sp.]